MAKKKKKQNPAKQLKNKHASNPLRQQEEAVRRLPNKPYIRYTLQDYGLPL